MKNTIGKRFHPSRDRIDVFLAVLGIVSAALLLPLGYVTSELFVVALPATIGSASIVYLLSRHQNSQRQITQYQIGGQSVRLLEASTILGIGILALLAAFSGERTLPFHVLSGVLGTFVLVNILFVSEEQLRPLTIITEIVLLMLVVEFAALLTTPGLIGVDTWTHVSMYADSVAQTGSLAPMAESKYITAPSYHLLIVTAAKLFGSSIRAGLYGSLALVIPFSTIVVYFVGRYLLSVRWALLAMALFALSDYLIHWSIDLIPTSMGLVLFLGLVYTVTKLFFSTNRRSIYVLGLVFGVALILTHQLSMFIALTFLASGVVAQLLVHYTSLPISTNQVGRDSAVNMAVLFFPLSVLTLFNWLLTPWGPGNFFFRLFAILRQSIGSAAFLSLRSVPSSNIPAGVAVSTVPLSVEVVDSLGFFILFFAAILGGLVILRPENLDQLSINFIFGVSVMIVFSFGLPLFGIRTFIPGRWYIFTYALLAVIGAIGLRNMAYEANLRTVLVVLLILALVFPGSMFVAQKATSENPVFDESYPRFSYTTSEIAAAQSIQEIQPENREYVTTDHPYRTLFARGFGQPSRPIQIDSETGAPAETDAVYRDYQSTGTPVVDVGESSVRAQLSYDDICRPSYAVVYDNGPVKYCRNVDLS